jgi:hypothetical protein
VRVIGRPTLLVVVLALGGATGLMLMEAALPASRYAAAGLGAACVGLTTRVLLRSHTWREASSFALGAAVLGFLAAFAAAGGKHPWPIAFAAAWLPALLLFLSGVDNERIAAELDRLQSDVDSPELRSRAIARAQQIRNEARETARALDPQASGRSHGMNDPRAIYAYAAQVAGFALALDDRFAEAASSLREVPPAWMPTSMRTLMLCNLSHWQLCTGDLAAAQRTLEDAQDEHTPPEVLPYLRDARAAVLVRTGEVEAALDMIGRKDGELGEPQEVQQRYRITRAHALAALGDAAAAREELARIVKGGGLDDLRRWIPAGGPALPAMRALVESRGSRPGT